MKRFFIYGIISVWGTGSHDPVKTGFPPGPILKNGNNTREVYLLWAKG